MNSYELAAFDMTLKSHKDIVNLALNKIENMQTDR